MSIKKQFLKGRPECKVTFKLAKMKEAGSVSIVGSFNNWDPAETKMNQLKDGSFSLTCYFETGKDVEFRYLVNNGIWLTEPGADAFIDTGMGDNQQNAVIRL